MDEVYEGCRTEEGVAGIHGFAEGADLALHEGLDGVCLRLEVAHKILVDVFFGHVDEFSFLADHLAVAHLDGDAGYLLGIAGGVKTECAVDGDLTLGVVVTEEDDVQSFHLLGDFLGGVLVVAVGDDASVPATVEEPDDDVGLLLFTQDFHPFAGARNHLFETHARPQVLVQPVGNGGCQHAEDGDAHALALQHQVGLDVGLAAFQVDDVRTEDGAVQFLDPLVVHLVADLDVVVAEGLGVVLQVVHHLGSDVGLVGGHEVGVVAGGLALQDVAVLKENQPVAHLLALALDVTAHAGHRARHGTALGEVVGKECSVDVGRLHDAQRDAF